MNMIEGENFKHATVLGSQGRNLNVALCAPEPGVLSDRSIAILLANGIGGDMWGNCFTPILLMCSGSRA